ncbi:DUF2000 domain-containing protein [bacterium]|nr:DUF2000 domain-containing protein [bacterium]
MSHPILNQLNDLPPEQTKRFVVVLNQKIELGRLMNALGHMTAGLINQIPRPTDLCFLEYQDLDGGLHPSISHFPFIVLKAENSNQIRKLRNELIDRKLPYTDFTQTMIVGGSANQLSATVEKNEAELEYFGLATFGDTEALKELTKRFSLFR